MAEAMASCVAFACSDGWEAVSSGVGGFSHSTKLMASPFDPAHGKPVLFFFFHHPCRLDELQVDCANRTQQPLVGTSGSSRSQSHLDSSSLRGKSPCRIGTALYGPVAV